MSYSRSIPNQILHYTASSPGYPPQAIQVGNFAFSDAGNAPTGSYGEFRGGLNPYAFTSNTTDGFINQTYVVYIHRNSDPCPGPSCYLIGEEKITPNLSDPYPGTPSVTPPWYNLIKFTQYIVGSVSGAVTGTIGYYGGTLSEDISSSYQRLRTTFTWYHTRTATEDPNLYFGATNGSIILVNKFYPPIIANTASRIFDCSFLQSSPYVPTMLSTGSGWQLRGLFNLAGLTQATVLSSSSEAPLQFWDFEGGYSSGTAAIGDHFYKIKSDTGFSFVGQTNTPSKWTLNLCVKVTGEHNGFDDYFLTHGTNSSGFNFWGIGWVDVAGDKPQLFETRKINTSTSGVDTLISGATFSLDSWIYISVTCEQTVSGLTTSFYLNGKFLSSVFGNGWAQSPNPSAYDVFIYLGGQVEVVKKYFKFLSYYPVLHDTNTIKDNFLRYALNSKIKNNNIQLALDTGTLVSHQGTSEWTDISGNLLHGVTASFTWEGYKPGWTKKNFKITHGAPLVNLFVNPFTISLWVWFDNVTLDSLIFSKGLNDLRTFDNGKIVLTLSDNISPKSYTSETVLSSNKWYNIVLSGTNPNSVEIFIFSHTGSLQDNLPTIIPAGNLTNLTFDDTSDIFISDPNENVRVASVIYWNTKLSQAFANDFFAIQKGRFGYDSNEYRIADIGVCGA